MTVARHYTQVTLHGLDEASSYVHTAWIPSRFAVVGRSIVVEGLAGRWLVAERHETQTAEWVEPKSRDHLHQREASDV